MIKVVLIFFLTSVVLFSQDKLDSEINSNRRELDRLKNEIKDLKSQIYKADKEQKSILGQLDQIEKEIGIISEIKRLLLKENRLLDQKIKKTKKQLNEEQTHLKRLQELYAKRVLNTYKYGKIKNLEILLNADSFNQALVRYKYLKIFAEQETRLIKNIKNKIREISNIELKLKSEAKRQKRTLAEKEEEQQKFIDRKKEKDILVKKIRWDKKTKSERLVRTENEYQKLYQIIIALEKKRELREESQAMSLETFDLPLKDFRKAKGKIPWPAKGKVIAKYGKQKNAALKTYIKNTGIDIKVNSGTQVHAVFQGLVSMITYLAGYGNTVILDHGEGYYSVYSHLDDVLVERDQYLSPGDIVGLAGSTGSMEGPKLHFEIYANKSTVDPLKWLKK